MQDSWKSTVKLMFSSSKENWPKEKSFSVEELFTCDVGLNVVSMHVFIRLCFYTTNAYINYLQYYG